MKVELLYINKVKSFFDYAVKRIGKLFVELSEDPIQETEMKELTEYIFRLYSELPPELKKRLESNWKVNHG